MDLQRNTHHVYRLMYHFVWIPKYRHKVFEEPYWGELKSIIENVFVLTTALLSRLTGKAGMSSRSRQTFNIHASYYEPCQRFLNAINNSTASAFSR